MLFNSYGFIFFFLPVALLGFFTLARLDHTIAAAWLAVASLFFYGWWNPAFVVLLLASIAFNYSLGAYITKTGSGENTTLRRCAFVLAISVNLLVLAYYKYALFLLSMLTGLTGRQIPLGEIVLPLGISFFTFTQIAFLVDAYRGEAKEYSLVHYALFVSYFPHLIAGPILHHKEMMPQFAKATTYRFSANNMAIGLTIFAIGLFKKTVLADGVAPYAEAGFSAAHAGEALPLLQAWGSVLAYSIQLYFDFSGYSDMAIGLSRMFGVVLPLNFFSPYRALSIIDFWRRWHMTLSRFLRDYVYIPLGGNRHGKYRRYVNLGITMLLGGLWHGAGWTFVAWGALHGLYLIVNHAWRALHDAFGFSLGRGWMGQAMARAITLLAVIVAWVFFRASSFETAISVVRGMCGLNGVSLPIGIAASLGPFRPLLESLGVRIVMGGGSELALTYAWVVPLWIIAILAPNTAQIMRYVEPALHYPPPGIEKPCTPPRPAWNLSWPWSLAMGVLIACGILSLSRVTEFLYFQF